MVPRHDVSCCPPSTYFPTDRYRHTAPSPTRRKVRQNWRRQWRTLVLPSASGPRIPPELFDHILSYTGALSEALEEQAPVLFDKRQLAHCALVCKRWAVLCRPKIYQEILVYKPEDVDHLRRMIDRPADEALRSAIRCIRLGGGDFLPFPRLSTPWIHRVAQVHSKLPHCELYIVCLAGPLPDGMRTLRSLHWNLPRSVPTHSLGLGDLRLHSIHFASFDDLVHLLDELPSLTKLSCQDVTWAEGPDVARLRSHRRPKHTRLKMMELNRCPVDQYSIWLVSFYRAPPDAPLGDRPPSVSRLVSQWWTPMKANKSTLYAGRESLLTCQSIPLY